MPQWAPRADPRRERFRICRRPKPQWTSQLIGGMAAVSESHDDSGIVEKGKHGSESDLRLPDELAATYADRIDGWAADAIKKSPLLIKSRVTGHKIHHDGFV